MERTELELIRVCQTIGGVAGWNSTATHVFAGMVGDKFQSMTLAEFLAAAEQYSALRDKVYQGAGL